MELVKEVQKLQGEMVENRRFLHANPETGFALSKTTAFVMDKLKEMGYAPKTCGKSVVATIEKKGKALLLRADMDALPFKEQTGLPFASKNGNMHACGHDMHTAMLLGVAKILKNHEKQLQGSIKFLFQPAEEILEGAKDALQAGVLENPTVGGAMMVHVMTALPMQSGKIVVANSGVSAPACDYFQIQVKGKSCHGSAPQNGVDALLVSAHILVALQELSAREIPAQAPTVLTIGRMQAGKAGNIIADSAILEGTFRAFDEEIRAQIKTRMSVIVQSIAKAFRARAKLSFTSGCPALSNDEKMCAFAEKEIKNQLGEELVINSSQFGASAKGMGGSEDFAYIAREVPSVMLALCAGETEKGFNEPLHHPKVRFDENALVNGVVALSACALAWRG